ncbi:MAG: hypothetical protein ACRDYC_12010 [Acidimicrobiales bacterium]
MKIQKRSGKRWSAGLVLAGAAVILPASIAWACLSLAGITTNQATIQPGGTLNVNGIEFGSAPVQIHLGSVTGPILGTATPSASSGDFTVPVTIPASTTPGQYVLVATETPAATGAPARAVIQVGTAAPAQTTAPRPATVLTNSGSGVGSLALIGLAAAAASLFIAGGISFAASRRRSAATESVKA